MSSAIISHVHAFSAHCRMHFRSRRRMHISSLPPGHQLAPPHAIQHAPLLVAPRARPGRAQRSVPDAGAPQERPVARVNDDAVPLCDGRRHHDLRAAPRVGAHARIGCCQRRPLPGGL